MNARKELISVTTNASTLMDLTHVNAGADLG